MSSCIVAGFTVSKTTPLEISVEEAINESKRSSSFLVHMLGMIEPSQIKSNEIAKDSYEECLQLREYLSEQLWSVTDHEGISSVQSALDDLSYGLSKYESINDTIDRECEFIDTSRFISAC
ncbi:hypothetical protein G6F46_010905 [Rhizopus delemar]|uniref:Uncharacterized protein n=2 Tax=Rhizopus TaxID=4842 RepID=A0A9P6ZA21_9FUNG|nr:hypothetical protein G6F43_011200 [Rhizopus delemar]KAG1537598.1 hypothetical protein G6F51_010276 [Rhizopus arrhizus]KAG1449408.1 hypothetical protein G6F55_010177 [Rhizopus delemar]KAG1494705.1 hypothetical protein G6F54_007683 [Rhizopus delemar]KAG1503345.1 hypothetical protein G6F53_010647 [Rhizopus delemar]